MGTEVDTAYLVPLKFYCTYWFKQYFIQIFYIHIHNTVEKHRM